VRFDRRHALIGDKLLLDDDNEVQYRLTNLLTVNYLSERKLGVRFCWMNEQVQAICHYGDSRLKSDKASIYVTTYPLPHHNDFHRRQYSSPLLQLNCESYVLKL